MVLYFVPQNCEVLSAKYRKIIKYLRYLRTTQEYNFDGIFGGISILAGLDSSRGMWQTVRDVTGDVQRLTLATCASNRICEIANF